MLETDVLITALVKRLTLPNRGQGKEKPLSHSVATPWYQ